MINTIKSIFGLGPKFDMKQLLENGALILDVRTKEEFASGHAKGSVNIPLNELRGSLKKLKDKNRPIITCCASGMRSATAEGLLRQEGYQHVYNGGSWVSVDQNM